MYHFFKSIFTFNFFFFLGHFENSLSAAFSQFFFLLSSLKADVGRVVE